MKQTKIVCTVGPSCEDVETLEQMMRAGMDVARLNFSHGTHENHDMLIKNVRRAATRAGKRVAILQDLQGPKIRVGNMPEEGIELKKGEKYTFDTAIEEYIDGVIPCGYKQLHEFMKAGERILLNDGKQEMLVDRVEKTLIHTTCQVGGTLTSHKGMNVPDTTLMVRAMTSKDKDDARFGVSRGVDLIALSFVMRPEDVDELHELIEMEQAKHKDNHGKIRIITKIERAEAIENIDAILATADGLMVARGDLGVETPAEHVPVLQKELIAKARNVGKPVIVATQMLDSMVQNPRPTRAEVSDVANAVIDHTDAVMLSNETATGDFPLEAVDMMARIAVDTEASPFDDTLLADIAPTGESDSAFAAISRFLAEESGAKAIILASNDGVLAAHVSRFRPEVPIVVCTSSERVACQLSLYWGVYTIVVKHLDAVACMQEAQQWLRDRQLIMDGDSLVVMQTDPIGQGGSNVSVVEKTVS